MKRLLLLGSGNIAGRHVAEFNALDDCRITACADNVPGRAASFAATHGLEHAFGSLEEAIAWGAFDGAVNATPDAAHKPTTLALLAAGKHVFCEKPLAPNYPDAREMTEAAERAGLVNMVNLTYRNASALQAARRLVAEGAIGELRHVEASYRQSWLVSKAWGDWRTNDTWLWRLSKRHGSMGVLGDIGIHILDFATYGAGEDLTELRADLITYGKAEGARIGDYELDANDTFVITGRLAGGALAVITASRYATGFENDLTLYLHGTKGALKVEATHLTSRLSGSLGEDVDAHRFRFIRTKRTRRNARAFADALKAGVNEEPSFRRAAELQRVLDAAVESAEKRAALTLA